jgi:putative hydrolase of the HAD superfamily
MTIKAVLFDLDNTLIDFMKMKKEASRAAAYAMVDAGLKTNKVELAEKLFDYYLKHGIESDDAFKNYLLKEFRRIDYRVLGAAVNAYLKEKYLHLNPYPCVPETLEQLKKKGLKLAVVSDGLRLKAWMRLNAAGLDKYFDIVVAYEDTSKKKPAPEPFLTACEKLGVKPQECLMVGDWPERDIHGAKAVGMTTCLAKYDQIIDKTIVADYELDEIKKLISLIS